MKKYALALSVAAAFGGAFAAPVGGTVNQGVDVKVTLAASCVANNGTTNPLLDFGTYTAFTGASNATPTASVLFKCSRGLAPTAAFTGGPTYSLAGLSYTLSVTGSTPTAASGTTDYDAWSFAVQGTMASGQAGDGTLNGAQTGTQTLQVSF